VVVVDSIVWNVVEWRKGEFQIDESETKDRLA